MVSTGLGVIGDIGKKTYNILLEDDEDSSPRRKHNVGVLFVIYHLHFRGYPTATSYRPLYQA